MFTQPALTLVRWGFYPAALAATWVYLSAEVAGYFGTLGAAYPCYLGVLIGTMLVLEGWLPLRKAWGMTLRLFLIRDVPMLVVNGAAIAASSQLARWLGEEAGRLPWAGLGLPWPLQALAALVLGDLAWYGLHRYSHESSGRLGQWLWRTHVLHHLPAQVYVVMHAAGHPIQGAYVQLVWLLPSIVLGLSPEAAFAAAVFTGFQGLVSHFNVDSRAGWLNRVFIGTELHRLHHSAQPAEAGNYAAVFSLWDQLWGSYRAPHTLPAALGVPDRHRYPADGAWMQLLALPFVGRRSRTRPDLPPSPLNG